MSMSIGAQLNYHIPLESGIAKAVAISKKKKNPIIPCLPKSSIIIRFFRFGAIH